MVTLSKQIIHYNLKKDLTQGAANMSNLFPSVILANKTTELLHLNGDKLIDGTNAIIAVQSVEK